MPQRPICRCPLCRLEKSMISRLEQGDSLRWYQSLAERTLILGAFQEMSELVSYMHSAGKDAERRRLSDEVYVALLREFSSPHNDDLLQSLLLRMLVPALHKELTTLAASFVRLSREDLSQQLVTACIQTMQSTGVRRKTSYLGKSIIERTRRNAIRWAIRQYRSGEREETGIAIDDTMKSHSTESSFEPEILLRHLLERCVRDGLLSTTEMRLLIAYEIEGFSGADLGKREGLSPKALSHRVRRTLSRLSRALKKSETHTEQGDKVQPE